MLEPPSIDPNPPANPGLDYGLLREEGTRLVQQLSSAVWTDYNEHDPGVTTLEQLCYALTELSYRAELPLEDLLVGPRTGRIDPRRQALFVPRRILPCSPVTADDYRRLVVDRVPGVANAWFVPRPSPPAAVGGLYDVFVYAPGVDDCPPSGPTGPPEELREAVRRVYARHRALCEDLQEVVVLGASPVVVGGDVELEDARDPDAVLARVLFAVSLVFAPELHRSSLAEMLEAGLPPSRILEGPLLRNGFIAGDQLQPMARAVAVSAVVRAIVRTAGVAGAARVTVTDPFSGRVYRRDQRVPVPERMVLQADARPDRRSGRFALRLTKNGVTYTPDPARVRRELDRLFAAWRRTVPLGPQYDEWFGFPQGKRRDLESYVSIQDQYPNVYGINAYGLPSGATPARRGQARQLKGYLLVFEQLLADFFAQLAHVRDLFSLDRRADRTYFWQYLDRSVPDVEPLLRKEGPGPGYHEGLPLLVRAMDPAVERRNRFLEFLLSLYGEALAADAIEGAPTGEALVAARRALLRRLVSATHDRGRGADVLAPPSLRNVAGLTIRSRIQLGMDPYDDRPLGDLLDEMAVELVEPEGSPTFGRTLARHADHIESRFTVPGPPAAAPGGDPLRGLSLTEAAIAAGASASHYRLGRLPGESEVALVCRAPSEGEWRLVGKYRDEEEARAAHAALVPALDRLARRCRQLYVVEHVLLRFARGDDEPPFDGTFTITAVLSGGPAAGPPADRRFAEEVLRANTPAHVAVATLFLGACAMRRFEALYWAWRDALRGGDERARERTSRRLRRFLERPEERGAA